MDAILTFAARIIEMIAESGAGFFSWGIGYLPEIPEELMDK